MTTDRKTPDEAVGAQRQNLEGPSSAIRAEARIASLVDRLARVGRTQQLAVVGLAEQLFETKQLVGLHEPTAMKYPDAATHDALAEPFHARQDGSVTELPEQLRGISPVTRAEFPIAFDASGFTGYLEAISPALVGWVCSPSRDECLSIALYLDERLVGIARASESRHDLIMAGHQGARVFAIPVPGALVDGRFHEIDLRLAGTAQSLFSRPLTVGLDSASQSTITEIPADSIAGSTAAWLVFMDSADGPGAPLRHATGQVGRLPSMTQANEIANAEQLYTREDIELLAQSALASMETADNARDSIAATLVELAQRAQRLRLVVEEIEEAVYRSGGPADLDTPTSHRGEPGVSA